MRWYHTIDLPDGTVTPGEFDLRLIVKRLPLPERMDGMRCLDVGGRDGFFGFEMEKRGAASVLSLDIEDPEDVDFPGRRPEDQAVVEELSAGNHAFEVAKSVLGSRVERRMLSAYRVEPDLLGQFDFVVIGTLLHHLRDPVLALSRIRTVVRGHLLINNSVIPGLASWRRKPRVVPLMLESIPFWWLPNPPALRRIVEAAGFEVERASGPYFLPCGPGFDRAGLKRFTTPGLRGLASRCIARRGDLHAWVLGRPRM